MKTCGQCLSHPLIPGTSCFASFTIQASWMGSSLRKRLYSCFASFTREASSRGSLNGRFYRTCTLGERRLLHPRRRWLPWVVSCEWMSRLRQQALQSTV